MVGYWATLSLNIPDFTRYAKSQESQIVGQAFGLPVAMTLYSFIGIACTSASTVVFGEPIWNPITLLGRFHQPLVAFLALISILIATLNVNIGANVVSPSNDFSNLAPKYISFRTGGLITGLLGLAMMPWKLMATIGSYIFGWLVGYSGLLGPVAGIMVTDYFFIRGKRLEVGSLYRRGGPYEYNGGINPRAIVALAVGRLHCAHRTSRTFAAVVVRLRVVRRLWHVGARLSGADAWHGTGAHNCRRRCSGGGKVRGFSLGRTVFQKVEERSLVQHEGRPATWPCRASSQPLRRRRGSWSSC